MQQTAVDWLIDQMFKQGYFDGNKPLSITNLDHLQHQAKLMEKHQIEKAWQYGQWDGWNKRENDYNPNYYKNSTGEDYYNWEFKYVYGQLKTKQ